MPEIPFRTSDLNIAALLFTVGETYIGTEVIGKKVFLLFENCDACEEWKKGYETDKGDLLVNPRMFASNQHRARGIIFDLTK